MDNHNPQKPNPKNDLTSEQPDIFSEFENNESEQTPLYTDEILDLWATNTVKDEPIKKKTSSSSKALSPSDEFKIMVVFLVIACLVFTVVYLFSPHNTDSPPPSNPTFEGSLPSTIESSVSKSSVPESSATESTEESQASEPESTPKTMTYNYITKSIEETHYGDLILVNQYYSCWADGEDTVPIYENKTDTYVVVNAVTMLNKAIMEPLNNMMDDFYEIHGLTDIMVTSAYRSYNTQVSLFNREVEALGSEEEAARWVARPGHSEHQTGLVFDLDLNQESSSGGIDYTGTGIYKWVNEHCHNYGFIIRYPDDKQDITGIVYEPWHFRYIGVPHATYMVENNLCLEEYIELLHTHSKDNPLVVTAQNKTWYIYSSAVHGDSAQVPVPADKEYTISGDNCGSFIICYENSNT